MLTKRACRFQRVQQVSSISDVGVKFVYATVPLLDTRLSRDSSAALRGLDPTFARTRRWLKVSAGLGMMSVPKSLAELSLSKTQALLHRVLTGCKSRKVKSRRVQAKKREALCKT